MNKVEVLEKLERLGLNVHNYIVAKESSEIVDAYNKLGRVCTIRTDAPTDKEVLLPCYVCNNLSDSEVERIAADIADKNLVAIIANGLRYDKSMRFNMVYKLSKNLDFVCEYSKEPVILRKMYNPTWLNTVVGNLNEPIRDWSVRKAIFESGRLDLRELRDILLRELDNELFDHYVEVTFYIDKVGKLGQDRVYWEIER